MIRINLLPHREHKRQARQRRFLVLLAGSVGCAALVVFLGYTALVAKIALQSTTNNVLIKENEKLDREIADIEKLKSEKQALLDRKKVVERLQSNRTESVHILDQLVRQTPEGVYLKDFKQTADKIELVGYAQSNARVSAYMRNLNDSPTFEQPLLVETKAAAVGNLKLTEFTLRTVVSKSEVASAPAAASPAVAPAPAPATGGGK